MIITTDNLKLHRQIFENLDSSTLVIFDVDDVLFEPCDQILKGHYFKEVLIFEHMIEEKYDEKTAEELYSIIWNERRVKAMEEETPLLIKRLQRENISVLALTNCMIGRYGLTKSVEDWRLGELAKCGYHLEKSWLDLQEKIFKYEDETNLGNRWLYKKGVIFANKIDKGRVLEGFLEHFNLKPQHIIFVDDLLKNLISVQDMCTKLNINFTGIEYIKAVASYIRPNNLDIAKMQVQILKKERKWVTDEEAQKLLINKTQDDVNVDEPDLFLEDLCLENLYIKKISPKHDKLESVIVYSIGNPTNEKIENILKSYEKQDKLLFGAFLSNKLVAVIGVKIQEKQITILHLSVLLELRGTGIGTRLLDFIIQEFSNHSILLETDEETVEFYLKFGFTCNSFKNKHGNLRYKCSFEK